MSGSVDLGDVEEGANVSSSVVTCVDSTCESGSGVSATSVDAGVVASGGADNETSGVAEASWIVVIAVGNSVCADTSDGKLGDVVAASEPSPDISKLAAISCSGTPVGISLDSATAVGAGAWLYTGIAVDSNGAFGAAGACSAVGVGEPTLQLYSSVTVVMVNHVGSQLSWFSTAKGSDLEEELSSPSKSHVGQLPEAAVSLWAAVSYSEHQVDGKVQPHACLPSKCTHSASSFATQLTPLKLSRYG
jgi:hypothetical protein